MEIIGLNEVLCGADLVITGEGMMDGQSLMGKVPVGVARRAKLKGIPVVAVVGALPNTAKYSSSAVPGSMFCPICCEYCLYFAKKSRVCSELRAESNRVEKSVLKLDRIAETDAAIS